VGASLCRSSDPDPGDELKFSFSWGDGGPRQGGSCNQTHTYSISALRRARRESEFEATFCVRDGIQEPGHEVCESRRVVVQDAPATEPSCSTDATGPGVSVTDPATGWVASGSTMSVGATAEDPVGVSRVEFYAVANVFKGPVDGPPPRPIPPALIGTVNGPGPTFSTTGPLPIDCGGPWQIVALAFDACGNRSSSTGVAGTIANCGSLAPVSRGLTYRSQLDLANGAAQIAVNNAAVRTIPAGHSAGTASLEAGENRIEMQVTKAGGQPGLWRVELTGAARWDPSRVRVTAGEIVSLSRETLVLRLKGVVGERVSIRFEAGAP
jgi:hypothetical protein